MTYISWFSDIGLYLEDYLMYKVVTLAEGIREPLLTCSSYHSINIDTKIKTVVLYHSITTDTKI